jgi:anaerobic nitric oxide reductase flavorubredoxin
MPAVEIRPMVFWIGVNDRTTDLFEGLWPISREGVSYNSYVIKDEKKVLVDLAKAFKTDEFFDQVEAIVPTAELDYIILNHMEPDHTGVLRTLRRIAPKAKILGSAKTKAMLESFYGLTENVEAVEHGQILNIGSRKLQFFSTPFVHWPETIMTYDTAEKILFSCDAFGSYGALRGGVFDDECRDHTFYEREALRYYVNIVAKFSKPVLQAIDKLADVEVKVIAPSHGLIWRKDPGRIVSLYQEWAGIAGKPGRPGLTLIYASMYGNTEKMMNAVAQGVSDAGVEPEIFDVARTHSSYILPALWTKSGVLIGAPTYEGALFPPMVDLLNMAALKRVQNKKAAMFGSYGWSGGALKNLQRIIEPLGWELTESLEFVGCPGKEDLKKGEELGKRFAASLTAAS